MKCKFILLLLTGTLCASAQEVPYSILDDDTQVNSIYILMDPDSLDALYTNLDNVHEYAVTFIYDRGTGQDTVENVGFRLRGNTSLTAAKKSFKISFNTFDNGRKFEGAEKLNLIGNHNDPTMSREKFYFDAYNRFGLPVRRVAFVKMFINGNYYGLYTSTEEYDEIFCTDRFGDASGNLYKCTWGSTLEYNGTNPAAYPSYELLNNETENDKSDLIHFTDVLNNTPLADLPCALEKIFEVDDFLKIYALDISTGHWDDYGANENNYYLYHDRITGRFRFLSYDCDNTLGVDWFGIDWANRDIYTWNFDGRPLVERLLQVPEYRDRFSYYLDVLVNGILSPASFNPHADSIRDLIAPAAVDDLYRTYDYGYSYDDFWNGFDTDDIDGHCPYGIKNFITARAAATNDQLALNPFPAIIKQEKHAPLLPQPGAEIMMTVFAEDDIAVNSVFLFYSADNIAFTSAEMFDDGLHNDGSAGDHVYGISIDSAPEDTEMYYYFSAEDLDGTGSVYPVCETFVLHIGYAPPQLVINEFMAINNTTIADASGGFDDYIEIYNPGEFSVYLGDKFLSDEMDNPSKWRMPDQMLGPDQYLIIWADDNTSEGQDHCSFKLDGDKDEIGIFSDIEYGYSIIDTVSFGAQSGDISTGRLPNGTGEFTVLPYPSPGANNEGTVPPETPASSAFGIEGNPSDGISVLQLTLSEATDTGIEIFSVEGKSIGAIENKILDAGIYRYPVDTRLLGNGMYVIAVRLNGQNTVYLFAVI